MKSVGFRFNLATCIFGFRFQFSLQISHLIVMVTIVMVIKVGGDEMVDDELEYVLLSGLSMMATVMTVMGLMMTTVLKN